MKANTVLAAAVAATLSGGVANSSTLGVTLVSVKQSGYGTTVATNITSSTATWSYDDSTQVLTQTGGTFNLRLTRGPGNTYFRHNITGLVIGNYAPATATSFECVEGNFGASLALSLCGNYSFGGNAINESTVTWGPGTSTARVLGGDDTSNYPEQSILFYNYFSTQSWDGTTLVLSNTDAAALGARYTWTLQATPVPIPPVGWLFGGALGVMGWLRRKTL